MPEIQSLVEVKSAHVWYRRNLPGERHALSNISMQVVAGERIGLLGASGSGKSTLLSVLAGLTNPAQGEVLRPDSSNAAPSLVFQFPERQLFGESVDEDVAYGLRQSGVEPEDVLKRVSEALVRVGLPVEEFAKRSPFRLSAGEQRRVALAGVLAQQRSLVLLDEPTLGLDYAGVQKLKTILADLHKHNVAYCVASHDADFIASTCARVIVLDRGKVEFEGSCDEFWRHPDRASQLGVRLPRARELAMRLQDLGMNAVSDAGDFDELVDVLESFIVSTKK